MNKGGKILNKKTAFNNTFSQIYGRMKSLLIGSKTVQPYHTICQYCDTNYIINAIAKYFL